MAIIKIKTKIELSEKELTGFRAAIEKMGLAPEEAVKLFFNEAVKLLEAAGETAYVIGETKAGETGVTLC